MVRIRLISFVAIAVALHTLSAWMALPFPIPVTLQLLSVFLMAQTVSLAVSLSAMLVYIALGLVGVPVFSGFQSGISALASPTFGYVLGFIASTLIMGACARSFRGRAPRYILAFVSLAICYLFAGMWYFFVYMQGADITFFELLMLTAVPFIIPDTVKLLLSVYISERIEPLIKKLI